MITQPGWLYEGNAVLHPRGSEYQTQFVLDGIPLLDNRSPSFGPEIEANDLDSVSIYTAGFPAEYGRKLGGVIELDSHPHDSHGTHGLIVVDRGSYNTSPGMHVQRDRSAITLSAQSRRQHERTLPESGRSRKLHQPRHNCRFCSDFDRDFTASDRLTLDVRHELSRFEIPNEIIQQQAGQLQTGDNFEIMGMARFQHIFSPDSLLLFAAMVRNNANDLYSNANSTPIVAFQHNFFNEGYFKASLAHHWRHHQVKVGVDSDTTFLHENFNYVITDPSSSMMPRRQPDVQRTPP